VISTESLTQIANFAVTYKCDSRCKTCNIWKTPNPEKGQLSLQEIQGFLELNYEYLQNIKSVQLTGGEAFLREDLGKIACLISEELPKCAIWIPTNGFRPEVITDAVADILDKDVTWLGVSVSVDGIGDTHDYMRGVDGSFDKCLETLTSLSHLRLEYPNLHLSIGMTVTPINYHQILDVYGLSKDFTFEFSLRPEHQSDFYYGNQQENSLKPNLDELWIIFRILARDIRERQGLRKSLTLIRYLKGTMEYIREPRNRTMKCTAGTHSIFLNPYGDVYPCIINNSKLGNIRTSSLREILSGPRAKAVRKEISILSCPLCWVECETYRDIMNDKTGLIETGLNCLLDSQNLGFR
jgi:radical SAM protein with 4Fe4S-binding SPASM domain